MMLEAGFFHADPHQGNVFYLPDNRMAFIDFGMVGRLSEARRLRWRPDARPGGPDAGKVADVLLDWSADSNGDAEALRKARSDRFVDSQYRTGWRSKARPGRLLADVVAILREHGLALPPTWR